MRANIERLLDDPPLRAVLAVLNGKGEETRIVGGAVRNALMGRSVEDIDLATTALPDAVVARAKAAGFKTAPTGITHGTVTIVTEGRAFEVTTLREDIETHGRHATVRFGRDFQADARRRDFTINALYLTQDGKLVDEVEGLADLQARRIRFIGDARTRIREDYLRSLRFFRFFAHYGEGAPDENAWQAIIVEREGLRSLSRERIRAELLKLLMASRAVDGISLLSETGFSTSLLGGVGETGRLRRAVETGADAADRLAAWMVVKREDVLRLRETLRLSNAEETRLDAYARLLAVLKSRDQPIDVKAMRALIAEHRLDLVHRVLVVLSGEPRPVVMSEAKAILQLFLDGRAVLPEFPLRGGDILAWGGENGANVGRWLKRARTLWLEQGCPENARETLLEAISRENRSNHGTKTPS